MMQPILSKEDIERWNAIYIEEWGKCEEIPKEGLFSKIRTYFQDRRKQKRTANWTIIEGGKKS